MAVTRQKERAEARQLRPRPQSQAGAGTGKQQVTSPRTTPLVSPRHAPSPGAAAAAAAAHQHAADLKHKLAERSPGARSSPRLKAASLPSPPAAVKPASPRPKASPSPAASKPASTQTPQNTPKDKAKQEVDNDSGKKARKVVELKDEGDDNNAKKLRRVVQVKNKDEANNSGGKEAQKVVETKDDADNISRRLRRTQQDTAKELALKEEQRKNAEELARLQHEAAVLEHAAQIKANALLLQELGKDKSKKLTMQKSTEPLRMKTHWDFLLEEMAWLAKDFERERRWKLQQCKKIAQRVSKSYLDEAARSDRREKEAENRTRRVARGIAFEVRKFWVKIEKLAAYKHQLAVEAKKKAALDKHLDFLVGQTERYSSMLAENLADKGNSSTLPLPSSQGGTHHDRAGAPVTESAAAKPLASATDAPDTPSVSQPVTVDAVESSPAELRVSEPPQPPKPDGVAIVSSPRAQDDSTLTPVVREDPEAAEPGGSGVHAVEVQLDTEDNVQGNDDYRPNGAGELSEDDEATLEEEERLAAADGHVNADDEVDALQRENELSVEELLARYQQQRSPSPTSNSVASPAESEGTEGAEEYVKDAEPSSTIQLVNGDTLPTAGQIGVDDTVMNEPLLQECDTTNNSAQEFAIGKAASIETPVEPSPLVPAAVAANSSNPEQHREEDEAQMSDQKTSVERLQDAAAAASAAQPTGYTFQTTKVKTKVPFLLKYPLREYQHIGLDWLATLYEKRLNGILADEMGLGKTIMTIALLAMLACEKGIWGPHLVVVPTSVMLNWEMEFKKWCPAFKIITYFGSAKERKIKRQGWSRGNFFHVCITTYRLVIQDQKMFRRKKWKYLILDEAHMIKNWRSQRWQVLLNFNSKRRILLTGTPLQNDLMELWSLMHFLMPHVFQSHKEFRDWFSNPLNGMVEGQEAVNKDLVDRLHAVLRPFLLRRLKKDVEKQLPSKHEHVIRCRLSKRQRNLYEDFMAASDTQATLASGNFLGLINVLMQLRKVCNHPDLFEGRPIVSAYDMFGVVQHCSSAVMNALHPNIWEHIDMAFFLPAHLEHMSQWEAADICNLQQQPWAAEHGALSPEQCCVQQQEHQLALIPGAEQMVESRGGRLAQYLLDVAAKRVQWRRTRLDLLQKVNALRCSGQPIYGADLRHTLKVESPFHDLHHIKHDPRRFFDFSGIAASMVVTASERCEQLQDVLQKFVFGIPAARAPPPQLWCSHPVGNVSQQQTAASFAAQVLPLLTPLRTTYIRQQLFFPDKRLLQYDCGKLQALAELLHKLRAGGHRALIFTQMTKMLDILESFISMHGYTYYRLDGSTRPEERQVLMQRFNTNPKIFLFILSTRSGGVGINLVGADTVIFYDSDWNPAMDLQAQDRCHRIGQTREVNIYRLICDSTIEENILKKAQQKRLLDDLVIQSGGYTTDFFTRLDPRELLTGQVQEKLPATRNAPTEKEVLDAFRKVEDESDTAALESATRETAAELQEFTEEVVPLDDEQGDEERPSAAASELVAADQHAFNPQEDHAAIALATEVALEDEMLADVRQMTSSMQNGETMGNALEVFITALTPIEKYALHWVEDVVPVVDSLAAAQEVVYEEREWELQQLEKLKTEQEAELEDEDDELVALNTWDTDLADEAYRQHVETAMEEQRQLQVEYMALQEQWLEAGFADMPSTERPVAKKKKKKVKRSNKANGGAEASAATGPHLKSSKKRLRASSGSDMEDGTIRNVGKSHFKASDEVAGMARGARNLSGATSVTGRRPHKVKLVEAISHVGRQPKPTKKKVKESLGQTQPVPSSAPVSLKDGWGDLPSDPSTIWESVSMLPTFDVISVKNRKPPVTPRVPVTKPRPYVPPAGGFVPRPVPWSPAEDVALCTAVYELLIDSIGPQWEIVSDYINAAVHGGNFTGKHRHPVHCRERYKLLLAEAARIATNSAANGAPGDASRALAAAAKQLKLSADTAKYLADSHSVRATSEGVLLKHIKVASLVARSSHNYVDLKQGPTAASDHFVTAPAANNSSPTPQASAAATRSTPDLLCMQEHWQRVQRVSTPPPSPVANVPLPGTPETPFDPIVPSASSFNSSDYLAVDLNDDADKEEDNHSSAGGLDLNAVPVDDEGTGSLLNLVASSDLLLPSIPASALHESPVSLERAHVAAMQALDGKLTEWAMAAVTALPANVAHPVTSFKPKKSKNKAVKSPNLQPPPSLSFPRSPPAKPYSSASQHKVSHAGVPQRGLVTAQYLSAAPPSAMAVQRHSSAARKPSPLSRSQASSAVTSYQDQPYHTGYMANGDQRPSATPHAVASSTASASVVRQGGQHHGMVPMVHGHPAGVYNLAIGTPTQLAPNHSVRGAQNAQLAHSLHGQLTTDPPASRSALGSVPVSSTPSSGGDGLGTPRTPSTGVITTKIFGKSVAVTVAGNASPKRPGTGSLEPVT
eukprot:jgi/Chlat1/8825/Chrsp91S08163